MEHKWVVEYTVKGLVEYKTEITSTCEFSLVYKNELRTAMLDSLDDMADYQNDRMEIVSVTETLMTPRRPMGKREITKAVKASRKKQERARKERAVEAAVDSLVEAKAALEGKE